MGTLIPQNPPLHKGGQFRICSTNKNNDTESEVTLWDRNIEGRFPEAKEVKQLVRDIVNPTIDLGHSDKVKNGQQKDNECVECKEEQNQSTINCSSDLFAPNIPLNIPSEIRNKNNVSIEYSSVTRSPDNGLYRASWYANELLGMMYKRNLWWKNHQGDIRVKDVPTVVDQVTLIPNRKESNVMRIVLNKHTVLFEQSSSLSTTVDASHLRKLICRQSFDGNEKNSSVIFEIMDDDEAKEARKYF